MSEGLKKVLYFLGTLEDADVDWLVKNGLRVSLPARTAFIREGESLESVYFPLEGEFSVTAERAGSEIARLTTGEILGEISFVDSRPPSATVTTTVPSVVGAVPIALLMRKLERDVGFASRFYKSIAIALADRLRVSSVLGLRPRVDNDITRDEVPPHLLDTLSMAGERFAEMQKRAWGA